MKRKRIERMVRSAFLLGALVMYSGSVYAEIGHNTLPDGGKFVLGNGNITSGNGVMNITQDQINAVIKWGSFDIGHNATVNFNKDGGGAFNVLNYVNQGNASEIHGTMNANQGNVWIVNPAGVTICKGAQINVGELYVSNKKLDESSFNQFAGGDTINSMLHEDQSSAVGELMSLGNIQASKVTFDGARVVLDVNKVIDADRNQLSKENIIVETSTPADVVIGYDAYDEGNKTYADQQKKASELVTLAGDSENEINAYMWVKDGEQLQAITTNLDGNYALNNSIDLAVINNFKSIGKTEAETKAFTGNFDGLGHNIFDLKIDGKNEDNVGLFAKTVNAELRNFNLIGGEVKGGGNVGAVAGSVTGSSISNVTNSVDVNGMGDNVGGLIGEAVGAAMDGLTNVGSVTNDAVNTGGANQIHSLGGIVGLMNGGSIADAKNMGSVNGENIAQVGGIVGSVVGNAALGSKEGALLNEMTVQGKYSVGGIVGQIGGDTFSNVTLQNATNKGDVTAFGFVNEENYTYSTDRGNIKNETKTVDNAYVGGIVGRAEGGEENKHSITDVTNYGNVGSVLKNDDYYIAGNVGGIIGWAEYTDITNAVNKENTIRGAHNVGGIAGYLENGRISQVINEGGDVMATGARNGNGYVKESVKRNDGEKVNIGNIGGIVGYMYGDGAFVEKAYNYGNVHSQKVVAGSEASAAANVGGIVGKVNRTKRLGIEEIKGDESKAAIYDVSNSGNVSGYTGVGGVAGMMYNGQVVKSNNNGNIRSTRKDASGSAPLNMGGVVGDSTEDGFAKILVYDCYNEGIIGDDTWTFAGRHVGGLVGRLSGDMYNSYNQGDIYNGYSTVGGAVGYMTNGNVKNVFNAGNVTVKNRDSAESEVGGLIGSVALKGFADINVENVYNLGAIRSFKDNTSPNGRDVVGGIIGRLNPYGDNPTKNLTISNAYTLGKLYAKNGTAGMLLGNDRNLSFTAENIVFYKDIEQYKHFSEAYVNKIGGNSVVNVITKSTDGTITLLKTDNTTPTVANTKEAFEKAGFTFTSQDGGAITGDGEWRIYNATPILNAFMPKTEGYFGDAVNNLDAMDGITSIQYGTAYNPFATIINANKDLALDWNAIGGDRCSTLIVNDAGLTLDNFKQNYGFELFGGTIYASGALTLNGAAADDGDKYASDIRLGDDSKLYGSSVTINAENGNVLANGYIHATSEKNFDDAGNAKITGKNVEGTGVIRTASSTLKEVEINGIGNKPDYKNSNFIEENIQNVDHKLATAGDLYNRTQTKESTGINGNLEVVATEGDVNLGFGVAEDGKLIVNGDTDITATKGSIFVDADMALGGNLTMSGQGKIALDISNVGKIDAAGATQTDGMKAFFENFKNSQITFTDTEKDYDGLNNGKILVNLWKDTAFDITQYDGDDFVLLNAIAGLNIDNNDKTAQESTFITVQNAEQLKGIQTAIAENESFASWNYALTDDIDATGLEGFAGIGTAESKFNGTFDGRDKNIMGLKVENETGNAGLVANLGNGGILLDTNIYASDFKGEVVGSAVGMNEGGRIYNVTAFGNDVTGKIIGGIVGKNASGGDVKDVEADVVLKVDYDGFGGGIVGENNGKITNAFADSDVVGVACAGALGGVAGVSSGAGAEIDNVKSNGIINGYFDIIDDENNVVQKSDNVGGIVGLIKNGSHIHNGYNESLVSGNNYVGGLVGKSESNGSTKNMIVNIVNVGNIVGHGQSSKNTDGSFKADGGFVGGVIGYSGKGTDLSEAINAGTITGEDYVGGIAGYNDAESQLKNITNESSANIKGVNYVGGITGSNAGNINVSAAGLINRGTVTGVKYVGGMAGYNSGSGVIDSTNSDSSSVKLYAAQENKGVKQYFGGIVGYNDGTIKNAMNKGRVEANGANYVGGVVGYNAGSMEGMGNANSGVVIGDTFVGGVAGYQESNIIGTPDAEIKVSNDGLVVALKGGAGGVFGENAGKLTYVQMENNGIVLGSEAEDENVTSATGGIIGKNSGDITFSSMMNNKDAQVIGFENVGGIIGSNAGKVQGGRDGNGTNQGDYYKYQVYNNGHVIGGTWKQAENGGSKANEIAVSENAKVSITVSADSKNIGGLIGENVAEGKLYAAYNTGSVSGGTNVGGIVGSNAGTVNQVFSTIADVNGKIEAIGNGGIAGGLIGKNDGTLADAYNTSAVSGGTDNSIVGGGSRTTERVYAIDAAGKIIGTENDANDKDSYAGIIGFEKDKADSSDGIWKIYDGNSNALLKVFLTKAEYAPKLGAPDFTYNEHTQSIVVKAVGNLVKVYKNDGTAGAVDQLLGSIRVKDSVAAHSLADFINTRDAEGKSNLLQGLSGKNIGIYDMFSSQQITTGGDGNHNNLGYDIEGSFTIKKPDNPLVPEIPDAPRMWEARDKYAWGDKKVERERKAEIEFVEGGMKVD